MNLLAQSDKHVSSRELMLRPGELMHLSQHAIVIPLTVCCICGTSSTVKNTVLVPALHLEQGQGTATTGPWKLRDKTK